MEVSHRHLRPNEIDHELIWLTISLGSLALAATWRWLGLPWPQCPFHTYHRDGAMRFDGNHGAEP